jgi:5-methylcytosine-specific restriction endonuclease McrA
MAKIRPDKYGAHRQAYTRNKKRILATQNICGICGRPVDLTLTQGDPLAPCIDHIIPVNKGGHPSDIDNLQLAHWTCNRQKSDKLFKNIEAKKPTILGNRNLPQSMDWTNYKA